MTKNTQPMLQGNLNTSKTDPCSKGVQTVIGYTGDGSNVDLPSNMWWKQAPCFRYSGHSFQAEAASVLTAAGLEGLIIKTMGRCMGEFSLLAIYYNTTIDQLRGVSSALSKN